MTDKLKIIFAPGSLDTFDGTQEDLDKLVKEITTLFESGDLGKIGKVLNASEIDDYIQQIESITDDNFEINRKRKLH